MFEALQDAIKKAQPETLDAIIKKARPDDLKHALHRLDSSGHYLLSHTILSPTLAHYQCALLLLEAGANPCLDQCGKVGSFCPLDIAINSGNIPLARLMLWNSPHCNSTYFEKLSPLFASCLQETALEVQKVYTLKINAGISMRQNRHEDAAKIYTQIATIYEGQKQLEENAGIVVSFAGVQALLVNYYADKEIQYLGKARACHEEAEYLRILTTNRTSLGIPLLSHDSEEAATVVAPFSRMSSLRERFIPSSVAYQRI